MKLEMKRKRKRIMAIVMAIMLVAGLLPSTSFADDTSTTTPAGYVVTVKSGGAALAGETVTYRVIATPTGSGQSTTTIIEDTDVTTDASGNATLTALLEKESDIKDKSNVLLILNVKKAGYYPYSEAFNINSVTGTKEIVLTQAYTVTVTDSDDVAIKDATITYSVTQQGSSGTTTIVSNTTVTTDSEGKVSLTALKDKRTSIEGKSGILLNVTVTKDGYYNETSSTGINAISGSQSIELNTVPVVTVTDKSAATLSGATVEYSLYTEGSGGSKTNIVSSTATTGNNGKAILSGLAAYKARVTTGVKMDLVVKKSDYVDKTETVDITGAAFEKTVQLDKLHEVTVTGKDGALLQGATITYSLYTQNAEGTKTDIASAQNLTATTDQNGKAVLSKLADYKDQIASGGVKMDLKVTKEKYYDGTETVALTDLSGTTAVSMTYKMVNMTISGQGLGNATIKINNVDTKSAEVEKNTTANVSIQAKSGYRITSVTMGNQVLATDTYSFDQNISVATSNVDLQVVVEKVWTVTFSLVGGDENGKGGGYTITPDCVAGSVDGTVIAVHGKEYTIDIMARSSDGYCIEKITVEENGSSEDVSVGTNVTEKEIKKVVNTNTTITVSFVKKIYVVSVERKGTFDSDCEVKLDHDKNSSEGNVDKYFYSDGESANITVYQSADCMIDTVKVGGVACTAGVDDNSADDAFPYTIANITGPLTIEVTYKAIPTVKMDQANPLRKTGYYTISFSKPYVRLAPASVSKNGRVTYVVPDETVITMMPDGTTYDYIKMNKESGWKVRQETSDYDISQINLRSITTYAQCRFTDMNLSVVIDNEAPTAGIAVDSTANNGFYAGDVDVTLTGTDSDNKEYSGIDKIEYWLTVDGVDTEVTTAYERGEDEPQLSVSSKIKIKADEYDVSNMVLHVTTTDVAGNTSTEVKSYLSIDVTAPQISLSYDNNNSYNGSKYFNAARTATVVINERLDGFDAETATNGIKITAVDGAGKALDSTYSISEWTTVENVQKPDDTTHTATITFAADANYTLAISFTDKAGNPNAAIVTGDSVAPFDFTVDTKVPEGTVTAKSKEGRSTTWERMISDLKFAFYSKASITLSGTSSDETSPILSVKYYKQAKTTGGAALKALTVADLNALDADKDWKDFKDFTVSEDEEFVVYVKITDSAGNYTYISTDGLIVDEHAPIKELFEPKVTVEPEQPVNGYYNKDVSVKVKVEDPDINGAYTGLKKVSYKIYNKSVNKDEPTQSEDLFTFAEKNPGKTELVQSFEGKLVVDSSKNNSNKVVVEIYAEDNAGNGVTIPLDLKIDTTAPTVDIKYSNNSAVTEKYFNAARTATITVTERNFDTADMVIKVTNTDGKAPAVSSWKKTKGTGNGDDTKWTATIPYTADGDYTFTLSYKDRAGNKSTVKYADGTVAAKEFTIDQTKPEISVSYDNNNAHNGEYYNAARRATVTVKEHNFDSARVDTVITAQNNGAAAAAPTISGWSTNGDVHTATISYSNDARYTFDISATDMAGNVAADFAEQSFYIDQTVPELQITGVEDQSANAGDVIPVVTYTDTNFDVNALKITLTGANRNEVELDGTYANNNTGGSFTFNNFAKTQDIDDIYVLSASLTDKAGNTVSEEITFSVNRFGSTYEFSDRTEQINESFIQAAEDIVVVETNPTELSGIKVTLFKNNETIALKEGENYKLEMTGGNGSWYHYTYTIFRDIFEDDGIYKLVLHSEDGAQNISENIMETKDAELNFGVDKTAPNIVVANLESKKAYDVDNMTVIMSANDNLKLAEVSVYLDGDLHKEWKDASLEELIDKNGELTFDIPGTSNKSHDVRIVCKDAAGNTTEQEITDFYVTTNGWILFFNNKPLFYGTVFGILAVVGFCVFIVVKRRKKA